MSGWSPALRIARRELLQAKGRTLLVLLMVLLPVLAVSAMSTLLRSSEIDPVEGLPGSLGTAQARVEVGSGRVEQDPFLRSVAQYEGGPRATAAQLQEVLPPGSRLLEVREFPEQAALRIDGRRVRVTPIGIDLTDPERNGPYPVLEGRAPTLPTEVAVSPDLLEVGVRIGRDVDLGTGPLRVTGTVGAPRDYGFGRTVYALPDALGLQSVPAARYWVSGPPVTWQDVLELNAIGGTVLSRAVVLDPPDVAAPQGYSDGREETIAVIALIAVMAVLEVVLLAGPAFAVGARRQRRQLALLAATGGEPAHVRRAVLAQGLLVGVVAAALGVPLGVATAALLRAPLERYGNATFGPFDLAPLDLLLVGLLGAGTALLAALVPAVVIARQPVVAALQGRRVTSAPAARPAVLGLVLLTIGVLMTLAAVDETWQQNSYSELGVAAAALPTVLGAVLLAPAALSLVGRLAGRFPLALRFAVRDADRQRGRTAPAVAAIAATVAGVVALGTAASSDAAENRRTYTPSGPPGVGVVTSYGPAPEWSALERAARGALPGKQVQSVRGLPGSYGPRPAGYTDVQLCRASERPEDGRCFELMSNYSSGYGSDLLVGETAAQVLGPQLGPGGSGVVERALQAGQVAVASPVLEPGERVELRLTRYTLGEGNVERAQVVTTVVATAVRLPVTGQTAAARAVLPEQVAAQLGEPQTVALAVGADLSRAEESRLETAARALDDGVDVRVERGYSESGDRTVLLVLSLVAALLVLAGTLAATSLALTEARPDLVTLGQVGARPRTRRAVAAGYALVLGVVGAALGIAAGLVPGIAAAVPLTRGYSSSSGFLTPAPAPGDFVVDIPWSLLLLLLVVLPLVAAAVAAASARGRVDGPRRVVA
ncbi:MAG: FtsX-like permease family protein [Frankiales bacterium]|nr:FtsX-like permease family protein [Frankiales bacterium]